MTQVEPARRAYEELGVKAVITGRRASQGGDRASLQPLEVDSTGLLKLNPLFAWNFHLVEWYVQENGVPRNKLLDQGYRSVGDWHSTVKSGEGDAGELPLPDRLHPDAATHRLVGDRFAAHAFGPDGPFAGVHR